MENYFIQNLATNMRSQSNTKSQTNINSTLILKNSEEPITIKGNMYQFNKYFLIYSFDAEETKKYLVGKTFAVEFYPEGTNKDNNSSTLYYVDYTNVSAEDIDSFSGSGMCYSNNISEMAINYKLKGKFNLWIGVQETKEKFLTTLFFIV